MLTVKDLRIEFFDHTLPEVAVTDVDFTMDKGEILGIVGESGSGKSLTAQAIAGLIKRKDAKVSGDIVFDGVELLKAPRSVLRSYQGSKIGFVFQEPLSSLNPVVKIGWQVEDALRVHEKMTKAEMKEKALKALEEVSLSDPERIYNSYPHELSGGQRQRVMIAGAMIDNPSLLIADEPTTALDVTVQAQIIQLLQEINRKNNTAILFISHDLSLVKKLCRKVLVMHDGFVVEQGDVKEIFNNPKEDYTKKLIDSIPTVPDWKDRSQWERV